MVLGVVASVKGSSPQKAGALAVFHVDGRIDGTLGGGCLEAEAGRLAQEAAAQGKALPFDIVLDGQFRWDDGMICGGRATGWVIPEAQQAGVEFWEGLANAAGEHWGITQAFEFVRGEPARVAGEELLHRDVAVRGVQLWVAGAGHIAQAVVPLARAVEFEVVVMDDREELANAEHFPTSTTVRCAPWAELLEAGPAEGAFGLIVTRGHEHDAEVLRAWLKQPFAWLGMIGSKRKARLMREAFVTEGVATAERMAEVECPVGLEIGAVSPQEIAVSIVARMIQRRGVAGVKE